MCKSRLLGSLPLVGALFIIWLAPQALGQCVELVGVAYDPPSPQPSSVDYNTVMIGVDGAARYSCTRAEFDERSVMTIGCFMNSETASAQKGPDKNWRDTEVTCISNKGPSQIPDHPDGCPHNPSLRLIEKWQQTGSIEDLFLTCDQHSGQNAIHRCFVSRGNQYIGWATAGVTTATAGRSHTDKVVLASGETICQRYFHLHGRVEGLEIGDSVDLEIDAPHPITGIVETIPKTLSPATGTALSDLPQVPLGTSYRARVVRNPEKKTCTFIRNGSANMDTTLIDVDERGRTSSGKDLTDLSIACTCKDGQSSCPPDGDLLAQTVGLEAGETAHVKVDVQFPTGQPDSDTYAINQNGTMVVIDNLPGGSAYTATFVGVEGRENRSCSITGETGTVGIEGATFQLDCTCPGGTSGQSRAVGASVTGCDEPPPQAFPEPLEEIEWFNICEHVERLCPTLDPWWWGDLGPATGREPCQRVTICTEGPVECHEVEGQDEPVCATTLDCVDQCMPQSRLVLQGPYVSVDGDREQPLSGRVLLSGWASDDEGVQLLRLYLDGQPLALDNFRADLFRPEACGPIQGDCSPAGFEGQLDTTLFSDGPHRLLVFAVDGRQDYPVPTAFEVDLVFENSCTSTTPPAGSLVAPIAGATVAGMVPVEVAASSSEGVERVRFYLDGVRVFTDWTAPYAWNWQTTGAPDGQHRLHADVLDTCGNVATIAERTVTVRNANDLPALAVETPTPLLDLAGVVPVAGWALDADRVNSIVLRLDGQNLPLASPLAWGNRSDVCSSAGISDPRCPNVGWSTSFDTTRWPDGTYRLDVVAIDGRGGSTSRSVWLSIRNTPVTAPIVSTPASQTVVAGSDVTFQVTGTGEGPLAYQWQYRSGTTWRFLAEGERGGRVRGVLTRTLTIHDVVTSDATAYRCLVSNEGGTTASGSASLTVEETIAPPTVTSGLNQRVTEGEHAFLTVSAQGSGPLTFRWQRWNGAWVNVFDGGRISGSSSSTLTIADTIVADQGLYRAQVSNQGGTTTSAAVQLTVDPVPVGSCVPNATTLCFQADRFAVSANFNGSPAPTMPFSEEGGFFWAFEPNTVEVVVKILDGRSVNGHFWVFHGALTDLAYTLTVTDTITGAVKTYLKGAGHFCGDADTSAFGGAVSGGVMVPLGPSSVFAPSTSCQSSPTAACLFNDKFRVEVHRAGMPQPGVAVTDLSASFGFVSAYAPEVVVKVIDGTSVNGWYWLFFGSLTHQAFTVEVTDTATGEGRSYASPDDFCGEGDTTAF